MRKIGYKDRYYYYKPLREMIWRLSFKDDINEESLKKAFELAFNDYPEFKVKVVKKDGSLYYETNTNDLPIYKEDKIARYYGTSDTNEYLFYCSINKNKMSFYVFHGLSDGGGFLSFIKNIIYYYFKCEGIILPDIRTIREIKDIDLDDIYDPYSKYAKVNEDYKIDFKDDEETFMIPDLPSNSDTFDFHHYQGSVKEFLDFTHKLSTSFAPAYIYLFTKALSKVYDTNNKAVVAFETANLRKIFNSKCKTNFSETAALPLTSLLRKESAEVQCAHLKSLLNKQLEKENIENAMSFLISAVNKVENVKDDITPNFYAPFPTYVLTYVGIEELPNEYNAYVELSDNYGASEIKGTATVMKTRNDVLDIYVTSNGLVDKICAELVNEFKENGLSIKRCEDVRTVLNKFSLDKIESVE